VDVLLLATDRTKLVAAVLSRPVDRV